MNEIILHNTDNQPVGIIMQDDLLHTWSLKQFAPPTENVHAVPTSFRFGWNKIEVTDKDITFISYRVRDNVLVYIDKEIWTRQVDNGYKPYSQGSHIQKISIDTSKERT